MGCILGRNIQGTEVSDTMQYMEAGARLASALCMCQCSDTSSDRYDRVLSTYKLCLDCESTCLTLEVSYMLHDTVHAEGTSGHGRTRR